VLDPAVGSPNASLLYDIKGARAFHRGEGGKEDVGVHALDEVTLVVELEGPTGYLPHLLTHNSTYPLPRHVVKAHGKAWTEVGHLVSNGPFRLESWQPGRSMVLSRNPEYRGRFPGNVRRVEQFSLVNPLESYEADNLDVFAQLLPPTEMDRALQRHAGDYVSPPALRTTYLGFDVSRPPFDDPRVRRAFVLATDRETLPDALGGYHSPAAGGFIPPGMPGHSPEIGLSYDPDGARQLLAAAGYPGGSGFPVVDSLALPGYALQSTYLQEQWQEVLEVEIIWELMELARFLHKLEREPPRMFLVDWLADYPDPDNFLRVFIRRRTRWRNNDYDRLVAEARGVLDPGERMRLYQQADRILAEEAPIVPLLYDRFHLLVKPWVKKYPISPMGAWFWKDVILELH
jgi:oligopeptide transport system substrate-binding protein